MNGAATTVTSTAHRVELSTGLGYLVRTWGPAITGAPATPPIVLIHGFLDAGTAWSEVAEALAARFPERTLIAPDLRGHGDSDRVGAGGYYHFFDYVADLDALVTVLALPTFDLIGHSMGGMVSSYFAGTRPERVRRLALLEGLGPPEAALTGDALPHRTRAWLDAWARTRPQTERTMPNLDAAAARMCKHDHLLTPERARLVADGLSRELAGGARQWKHDPVHLTPGPIPFRRDHAEPFWRAITAEALVVDGALSVMRLADADAAARAGCIRNARHVVLAGAGHMLMRHQPAALAALLGDFVAA